MRRRTVLRMAAAWLAASALPGPMRARAQAQIQAWPSRTVRIVAPSAPGGSLDILARMFARGLTDRLGQSFVVENRAGGGGNIGFDAVAKSTPDGYTIMIGSDPLVINPIIYSNLTYDPVRDFAPIITIATLSQVLAVHPEGAGEQFRRIRRAGARAPRARSMSARQASARPAISPSRCSRKPASRSCTCPIAAPARRSSTPSAGRSMPRS